jgi:RND family efflux transporter MFP subunit
VVKSLLSILTVLVVLVSCGEHSSPTSNITKGSAPQTASAEEITTVAVAKTAVADLSQTITLTAEFTPFQEIDVMAKVSGYVKQIYVDIGDRVRQGQLLAVLELPEMTDEVVRAKAAIQRAQAQVVQGEDEVHRAESSHQISHLSNERLSAVDKTRPGLIAQQELDDAQGKDLAAEAQIQAAKSSLTAAAQQVDILKAELARIQTMFDYTKVTAPFAGVITKRYANLGSMIQAGTSSQAMPLVRLSDNSLLRLTLPVPESAVPTVHTGQAVDVHVPTLNRNFPGKVARFSDKVQTATRTMDTEVDVPNPALVLVPGMYAEVNLMVKSARGALCVPVGAVDFEAEGKGRVLVVTAPGNKLEPRAVSTGLETANRIEIRSGLQEGDMVVVSSRAGLRPGATVSPKPAKEGA